MPSAAARELLPVHVGGEAEAAPAGDQKPVIRGLALPMLVMFQGYAAVAVLQFKLKAELGIGQTGDRAHMFTQAAVFMHYGKFASRLGQDLVFRCLPGRVRVQIAMVLVLLGSAVPPLFVWAFGSKWVGLVVISFGLVGIGVGMFECTYLAVIRPLGHLTKAWAIMGAPLGFAMVDIFGLLCTSAGMPPVFLYWYVVASIPVGMLAFELLAPTSSIATVRQVSILAPLPYWRRWLPVMLPFFLAKVVGSFVMEDTPTWFYVFNDHNVVPLLGPRDDDHFMNHDLYFAMLYVFVLLGDGISRRVPYFIELDRLSSNVKLLVFAVVASVGGFFLQSLLIAVVTLFAAFLAFWGNGLVYGVSAKYIDKHLPTDYSLALYSYWCFVGDIGSIAGAALVDVVRNFFCDESYAHMCK